MKKYIPLTTTLIGSFFLTSCGGKDESTSSETSSNDSAPEQVQKKGAEQAIKEALKSQVNSTTADLMLKTPSFAELAPADYDLPSNLEGREMVPVTVQWRFLSKGDLYVMSGVLDELPDKPVVIEQVYEKGELIEYVEARFVLQANGSTGYLIQDSRFTKQQFRFDDYNTRQQMGKVTLIRGSEEHLAAAQKVSEIKQAEEEKLRLEKLETEKQNMAEYKNLVSNFSRVLSEGTNFKCVLPFEFEKNKGAPVIIEVLAPTEKAGRQYFTLKVTHTTSSKNKEYTAKFHGYVKKDSTVLSLDTQTPSVDTWNSSAPRYLDNRDYKYEIELTDSDELVGITIINTRNERDGAYEMIRQ